MNVGIESGPLLLIGVVGISISFPIFLAFVFYVFTEASQEMEKKQVSQQNVARNALEVIHSELLLIRIIEVLFYILKNFKTFKKKLFLLATSLCLTTLFGFLTYKNFFL